MSIRCFKRLAACKLSVDGRVLLMLVVPPPSPPLHPVLSPLFLFSTPLAPALLPVLAPRLPLSSPAPRLHPTPWRPFCRRGCSWSSWTTCSTGSAAAGRRPTSSCCCSAAARSPTGWPPRCCSARPRASARSCSRSSSRSRPCECGRPRRGRPWPASSPSMTPPAPH